MFWSGFAIGLFLGGAIGLLVTAVLVAGREKECGGGSNPEDL